MADGVPYTPDATKTIATDDVAGVGHVQRIKLTVGGDGVANDASAANPLPVSVPAGGATEATLASVLTDLAQKLEPADLANLAVDATAQAIRDRLGATSAPMAGTTNKLLTDLLAVAATAAKQDTAQTRLDLLATEAKLEAVRALLAGTLSVDVTDPLALDATVTAVRDRLPAAGAAAEATLASVQAALANRYGGGKTAAVATATAAGDTTVHTPAAGKRVKLYWITAINDPDESSSPLIKVLLGTEEKYRGYALAHWEPLTGPVDGALKVNLSGDASVAVTAHLEEVT